ncbi:hypothetical protein VV97_22645 [Vibrio vulnificus]|nr:hypothetical protein VV97_22645 [Vibrio vulnificus]
MSGKPLFCKGWRGDQAVSLGNTGDPERKKAYHGRQARGVWLFFGFYMVVSTTLATKVTNPRADKGFKVTKCPALL